MDQKKQNIEAKEKFKESGLLLLRKVKVAEPENVQDALASWQKIEGKIAKTHVPFVTRSLYILSFAASIALLVSIGLYYWMEERKNMTLSVTMLETSIPKIPGNEITLIEKNGKLQLKDASSVRYDAEGKSNVEEYLLNKESEKEEKEKGGELNQLIVPKGRKADITFSDGTKISLNAGSRVIYPSVFRDDKREILVEGEAYLDVTKDPSHPFIVKTNGFDVKVLGTQFNICAYKEDASASVVLVEGRVEVNTSKNEKEILVPNQLIEISEKGTKVKDVDVYKFICWKDNIMMLDEHNVGEVLDKLSRFYGRSIQCSKDIRNISISGKLDLRKNMEEVINIICQSLYLKYKIDENNNVIILK